MPKFGTRSMKNRATLHSSLRLILDEAINHIDFSIRCGYRNKREQNEEYDNKRSKLRWPNSRHNTMPSGAVDVYPSPCTQAMLDDPNHPAWCSLASVILCIAQDMGIGMTWGGTWQFKDCPHYQTEVQR